MIEFIKVENERKEKEEEKLKNYLSNNRDIVGVIKNGSETLALDKEHSQIKIFDNEFNEIKTLGSRFSLIEGHKAARLGFEFPEDILSYKDTIYVSDSGNDRIVVIDKEYNYIRDIKLPESPYKFLYIKDDLLLVSDFNVSVLYISVSYGYIGTYSLKFPADFSTSIIYKDSTIVGDENGNEYRLLIENESVFKIAKEFDNKRILLQILLKRGNSTEEIRDLISDKNELILKYLKESDDDFFNVKIKSYIDEKVNNVFKNDFETIEKIYNLSLKYFYVYKILNTRGDQESGSLIKEMNIYEIFNLIKLRRDKLKNIINIRDSIKKNVFLKDYFKSILDKRAVKNKRRLVELHENIINKIDEFGEEEIIKDISEYWLLFDEIKILFDRREVDEYDIKTLTKIFYNSFLKDFYFNISLLYLHERRFEKFYFYAEKELFLYNDKIGIMLRYVKLLINMKEYNRALKILGRNTDKNKEHINYNYYLIYSGMGENEKAFSFLKKEFELFPHKKDLIPELLNNNIKDTEFIKKIIGKLENFDKSVIDTNYNIALALFNLEEYDKCEEFLYKELDLFPENRKAVLLKLELMLKKIPDISHNDGIKDLSVFIKYLKTLSEEASIKDISFLIILNFVQPNEKTFDLILSVDWNKFGENYSKEIDIYFSFCKYILKKDIEMDVKTYKNDIYLSSKTCSYLSFRHFLEEAKILFDNQKYDEGFAIIEDILKYNPGNELVFDLLDSINTD